MNTDHANGIPLSSILQKLALHPTSSNGYDLWYNSPLRNEKTPSFHIHTVKNVWYDFGAGKGGSVIDFVCAWLESHCEDHTVADALRWLDNMHSFSPKALPLKEDTDSNAPALELRTVSPLQNPLFINYLSSRGIPLTLAKRYLKEANVRNSYTGKTFSAIAIQNESGGYELRNKFFKGCIAPKDIAFIRGRNPVPNEVHIFEGFMDFLSALIYEKTLRFEGDAIILNSVSGLNQAWPYLKGYGYKSLYTWLDNDSAGETATQSFRKFAKEQKINSFQAMNQIYAPHKDVNAWHMNRLEL